MKIKNNLISELIKTIVILNPKSDLLSIVCSYGDTQTDKDTLKDLEVWNNANSN